MSIPEPVFRRSSYSNGTGANCIEAGTLDQRVVVRDSKTLDDGWGVYPTIAVSRSDWRGFLTEVGSGSFTL